MVQYSNGVLKTRLKKPVYGPKCPVFELSVKSRDLTIWILDTKSVRYPGGCCIWISRIYVSIFRLGFCESDGQGDCRLSLASSGHLQGAERTTQRTSALWTSRNWKNLNRLVVILLFTETLGKYYIWLNPHNIRDFSQITSCNYRDGSRPFRGMYNK